MKNLHHKEVRTHIAPSVQLTKREREFLTYCAKDLTYSEIADLMGIGIRTADYYRDSLFAKLNLNTRVGLTLYAIRIGLVSIQDI